MPLLTDARQSVWTAIDNWPPLADASTSTGRVFNATYRFDDEMALLSEIAPSLSDLPALVILPLSAVPAWYTNEMQVWPLLLEITLFTQDWNLGQAEDLIERVCDAIYQSHPAESSVPYVKSATGYYPQRLGPIAFHPTRVGKDQKLKVIQTKLTIALRLQKDPFGD